MQLQAIHLEKADDYLQAALQQASGHESLCAILVFNIPEELPPNPDPRSFPNRTEWRRAIIDKNQRHMERLTGKTRQQMEALGLEVQGGYLGQVVATGPAAALRAALELDGVQYGILDREIPFFDWPPADIADSNAG